MSKLSLRLSIVAAVTPLLMLASQTNVHALIQQSSAFTVLGQSLSATPNGCGPGIWLESFAGWNTSTPSAGTPLGFELDLCHANLPPWTTGFPLPAPIPVYGYYNPVTIGADIITGHITFLSLEIPNFSSSICIVHYALDFVGQSYISTTTPDSVGTTVGRWPAGAIRLDRIGGHGPIAGAVCNTNETGPDSVGGQLQITGPS